MKRILVIFIVIYCLSISQVQSKSRSVRRNPFLTAQQQQQKQQTPKDDFVNLNRRVKSENESENEEESEHEETSLETKENSLTSHLVCASDFEAYVLAICSALETLTTKLEKKLTNYVIYFISEFLIVFSLMSLDTVLSAAAKLIQAITVYGFPLLPPGILLYLVEYLLAFVLGLISELIKGLLTLVVFIGDLQSAISYSLFYLFKNLLNTRNPERGNKQINDAIDTLTSNVESIVKTTISKFEGSIKSYVSDLKEALSFLHQNLQTGFYSPNANPAYVKEVREKLNSVFKLGLANFDKEEERAIKYHQKLFSSFFDLFKTDTAQKLKILIGEVVQNACQDLSAGDLKKVARSNLKIPNLETIKTKLQNQKTAYKGGKRLKLTPNPAAKFRIQPGKYHSMMKLSISDASAASSSLIKKQISLKSSKGTTNVKFSQKLNSGIKRLQTNNPVLIRLKESEKRDVQADLKSVDDSGDIVGQIATMVFGMLLGKCSTLIPSPP